MARRSPLRKFVLPLLVTMAGALVLATVGLSRSPDFELRFERRVPSTVSVAVLTQAMGGLANWPDWFYSLKKVETVQGDGELRTGQRLKLWMEPPSKPWKRFEVEAEVLSYKPGRELAIRVLGDSQGKINRILTGLTWRIELLPRLEGAEIIGSATARTAHWRSRLLGRLIERIVMNQVFYPNLTQLSRIKQPLPVHPTPEQLQERLKLHEEHSSSLSPY